MVFVDISFRPNYDLEARINRLFRPTLRFEGSGTFLGKKRTRDLTFGAALTKANATKVRAAAHNVRRWKGVKSVGFSILEDIPLRR